LFVSPINSSSVTYNQLSYNTASKEIIYSSVAPKYYTYSKTFTSGNSSNLNLFTTTTHCSVAIVGYASYSSGGYDTSGAYVDYRFVVTDAVDDGSGGNTTARACINTFIQYHGFTVTANQIGTLNYLFQLVCSNTGALTTSAIGMTVIVTVC